MRSATAQEDDLDALLEDAPEERSRARDDGDERGPGEEDREAAPERAEGAQRPSDEAVATPEDRRKPAAKTIEEIVVTARRRMETLEDVPVSITVLTGDDLVDKGLTSTKELESAVPGMIVNESGGFGRIFLRGFGSNAFVPFVDPTVAVFIDGAYSPSAAAALQYLGNVKDIQVLKGPQGTLFGRNTTAGAVQIQTQEPTSEFQGRIGLSTGSRYEREGNFYLSGPIFDGPAGVDFAGIALGGFSYGRESHERNVFPEVPDLRPTRDEGAFGKLVVDPLDWLSFRAMGIYGTHDGAAGGTFFQAQKVGALNPGEPDTTPRVGANNVDPFGKWDSNMVSLKTTARFEPVELWVQGTRNETSLVNLFDGDGTGEDAIRNTNSYLWEGNTFEAQLSSARDWSLFGMPVNWLVGAYHFEGDAVMDPVLVWFNSQVVEEAFGSPVDSRGTPLERDLIFEVGGVLETRATAGFANAGVDILDWLTLDFGLRYSDERRTAAKSRVVAQLSEVESAVGEGNIAGPIRVGDLPFDFGVAGDGVVVRDAPPQDLHFDDLSLLAGLNFHLPDGSLFYLKYSEGFKAGTWNLIAVREDPSPVPEETVRSQEIGFKGTFLDRRVQVSTAAFRMSYEGLQAYQVALVETGTAIVRSIDRARTLGAEMSSTFLLPLDRWDFLPADRGRLNVGASFLDGEIEEWRNAPTFDPETYLSETQDDLGGNKLHSSPKWTVAVDLEYGFDAPGGGIEIGTGYYYNSGFLFDPQNFIEQGGYSLLSARLGYELVDWGLRAVVVGNNLTGSDYRTYGQVYDFGEMVGWGPAEEVSLKLSWRF